MKEIVCVAAVFIVAAIVCLVIFLPFFQPTQTFLPNEPPTELLTVDTPRKLPLPIPPEPKSERGADDNDSAAFIVWDTSLPEVVITREPDGSLWRVDNGVRKRLYEKSCSESGYTPVFIDAFCVAWSADDTNKPKGD